MNCSLQQRDISRYSVFCSHNESLHIDIMLFLISDKVIYTKKTNLTMSNGSHKRKKITENYANRSYVSHYVPQ